MFQNKSSYKNKKRKKKFVLASKNGKYKYVNKKLKNYTKKRLTVILLNIKCDFGNKFFNLKKFIFFLYNVKNINIYFYNFFDFKKTGKYLLLICKNFDRNLLNFSFYDSFFFTIRVISLNLLKKLNLYNINNNETNMSLKSFCFLQDLIFNKIFFLKKNIFFLKIKLKFINNNLVFDLKNYKRLFFYSYVCSKHLINLRFEWIFSKQFNKIFFSQVLFFLYKRGKGGIREFNVDFRRQIDYNYKFRIEVKHFLFLFFSLYYRTNKIILEKIFNIYNINKDYNFYNVYPYKVRKFPFHHKFIKLCRRWILWDFNNPISLNFFKKAISFHYPKNFFFLVLNEKLEDSIILDINFFNFLFFFRFPGIFNKLFMFFFFSVLFKVFIIEVFYQNQTKYINFNSYILLNLKLFYFSHMITFLCLQKNNKQLTFNIN